MEIAYKPAIQKGANHELVIRGESITTTKAKEVLKFAKKRVVNKEEWADLKEAVRLGKAIEIEGVG